MIVAHDPFLCTREIPLTRGRVALVDAVDYPALAEHRWCAIQRSTGRGFYAMRTDYNGGAPRSVYMHRAILGTPAGRVTDHRNQNPLDNRRANLRVATKAQNATNSAAFYGKLPRGVQPRDGKWRAAIRKDGRRVYLGTFDTPDAAHDAYVAAARELHGDFLPSDLSKPTPAGA